MLIGKIVDTQGDGNYKSNILQQYSVRVAGWGVTINNCKVATQHAGFNGAGHYAAYQKGDVVICMSKEGSLDELTILGSVRLNGNHKDFANNGQGLRPGELVKGASGAALTNQASLHPSRVTKPDSEFYLMGINNIVSEYQDPIFGDDLETLADFQPLPGIIQSRGRGGVILNYAYSGIINYTDGNNVIVSGGTSENKCTRMLKTAKRHTEIAKQLSTITGNSITDDFIDSDNNEFDTNTIEFGELVTKDLQIVDKTNLKNIDIVEQLIKGTIQPQSKVVQGNIEEIKSILGSKINATKNQINNNSFENHPAPPAYRQQEHLKLAKAMTQAAQDCNTQSASMHQQAALMCSSFGNNISCPANPQIAGDMSGNPNQETGLVNSANMGNRNISGFIIPVPNGKVYRGGGEFGDPRSYGPHSGIDFGLPAKTGDPILAAAAGIVTQAGGNKFNTVIIKHDDIYTTKYLHNSQVLVQVGQKVEQGQVIATLGFAGSGGPSNAHLHFDIIKNGVNVNPEFYLGSIPRQ